MTFCRPIRITLHWRRFIPVSSKRVLKQGTVLVSSMDSKLWAKRSYQSANLIVMFGYYLGSIPVKWNKGQNKMDPVTSRRGLARWALTIAFLLSWEAAIALNYLGQMFKAEDMLEFLKKDALRLGIVALSFGAAFFHLHTAWKYREFVAFINHGAQFYEYFQSKYATKRERRGYTKEDTISGIMKIGFLVVIFLFSALFTLAYLLQCRKHVLYYILPICNTQYPIHIKIPMKILGCITQIYFVAVNASGVSLYVDLFAAVVLMGLYVIREMQDGFRDKRRTKPILNTLKYWHHNFRCCELVVKELNECIGEIFMPVHMTAVVIVSSGCVVILIRYDLGPMVTLCAVMLLILVAGYYKLLIGRGSNFCRASSDALQSMRWKVKTPLQNRLLNACGPLKPNVGGLFPLKEYTVATMYQTSVEFTSELLLVI